MSEKGGERDKAFLLVLPLKASFEASLPVCSTNLLII